MSTLANAVVSSTGPICLHVTKYADNCVVPPSFASYLVKLVVVFWEDLVKMFEIFLSFSQFLQENFAIRLEICNYRFLPHSFKFIIQ